MGTQEPDLTLRTLMIIKYYKKLGATILIIFLASFSFLAQAATESVSVSASAGDVIVTPNPGGGGGLITIPKTIVKFSGFAYPNALVTILQEGKEKTTIVADEKGVFSTTFEEKFDKSILYSLFAKDAKGQRSVLLNYPVVVYEGYLTHLSGIRFAPTIITDKAEVKAGDYLTISGYSLPNTEMQLFVEGNSKQVFFLESGNDGQYQITIPLLSMPKGEYTVYINYKGDVRNSKLVRFVIGENNVLSTELEVNVPGDCNADSVINLVDFSVLAFWYQKSNPPICVDINKDKVVDLTDFSILAYFWTG